MSVPQIKEREWMTGKVHSSHFSSSELFSPVNVFASEITPQQKQMCGLGFFFFWKHTAFHILTLYYGLHLAFLSQPQRTVQLSVLYKLNSLFITIRNKNRRQQHLSSVTEAEWLSKMLCAACLYSDTCGESFYFEDHSKRNTGSVSST